MEKNGRKRVVNDGIRKNKELWRHIFQFYQMWLLGFKPFLLIGRLTYFIPLSFFEDSCYKIFMKKIKILITFLKNYETGKYSLIFFYYNNFVFLEIILFILLEDS